MARMTANGSGFNVPDSGFYATASFTPTAAAYGAGDLMDVAKRMSPVFADGTAVPAGALLRIQSVILKIDQTAPQASEAAYTLYLYNVTPPSAQTDNAAWSLASADLASYLGAISAGTPADLGAACYVQTGALTHDIKLASGETSFFAELVTVAGFTATAVARQIIVQGSVI